MPSKELCDYYSKIYELAHQTAMEAVRHEVECHKKNNPALAHIDPFGSSPLPHELCGSASVRVNGNSSFGRWAMKFKGWRVYDPPGVCLSQDIFGQIFERQVNYAEAFVDVLEEAGIHAWYTYRLD